MRDNEKYQNAIDYTIDVLLSDFDCDRELCRKSITYSDKTLQQEAPFIQILPSGFFSDKMYGTCKSLPSLPLENLCDIPILYGSPEIKHQGNKLIIHADIIASAYFLLTRYEEMVRKDVRDQYGRFPGKQSLPYRAGFIDQPIVNEYALLLRKWLREIGLNVPEPRRNFSVLLTHDVDYLRKYQSFSQAFRTTAAALLGKQPINKMFEGFTTLLKLSKDPYDTFDEIIKLDETLKANSNETSVKTIYFFMASNKNQDDTSYDINNKDVKRIISEVQESGPMIGFHTSYSAGINPALIANEKTKLENACGFPINFNRNHNLAWREIQDGWSLIKAGLNRDSTLGYADVAGFRLGVCKPIPLFDPIKMQAFGIEEHPLTVMDVTLNSPDYMNLSKNEAFLYCKKLIDQTRKHNGEFVILWHNNRFLNHPYDYLGLYRRVLNELNQNPSVMA